MTTGPTINRHGSKQDYQTPRCLIESCERKFNNNICFDLAASEKNAVIPFYYDEKEDALSKDWPSTHWMCWLNPPFGNITPWAKKCHEQSLRGVKTLLLTPASIGANWFRDHVHGKAMVLALNGRIKFVGASGPFPKDCMISAFGFGCVGFDVWDWKKELPPKGE